MLITKRIIMKIIYKTGKSLPNKTFRRCPMKKLTLVFTVFALALIPSLLLAQPPRPRPGQMPHGQPQAIHSTVHPTMQVHTASYPPPHGHMAHRPPVHSPMVHPHAVAPHVVAPYVVAPQVVAPYAVAPCYHDYYAPAGHGFSLTIGGRSGVFSISTGY